ncbi:MAG: CBS domain-containing protein [Desulfobacteraceae bacterium]|jgi:CBS domain-containing protein
MTIVKDIMTQDVITVTPKTEITQAARILIEKHINGLPVVDDSGKLLGLICQSDIIAQQKKMPIPSLFTFLDGYIALSSIKQLEREVRKIAAVTVEEAMSSNPVTVRPDSNLETVAALMVDHNYHTLPVVSEGCLVRILGKEDVLRILVSNQKK